MELNAIDKEEFTNCILWLIPACEDKLVILRFPVGFSAHELDGFSGFRLCKVEVETIEIWSPLILCAKVADAGT